MIRFLRWPAQLLVYAGVALALGYFSTSPSYQHFPPEEALIKLSFTHGAARKGGCRRRTAAEIAALAPNMRKPFDCPRERLRVAVELLLDGKPLYSASLRPSGLSKDGPARVYARFPVKPGSHLLVARLRDSARTEGFDYERTAEIDLAPRQNFVVDFRTEAGGFVFR